MSSSKKFKLIYSYLGNIFISTASWYKPGVLCYMSGSDSRTTYSSFEFKKRITLERDINHLLKILINWESYLRLNEGQGIAAAMTANKDKWHNTCRLHYNSQNLMLQRAGNREYRMLHTSVAYCSLYLSLVGSFVFFLR